MIRMNNLLNKQVTKKWKTSSIPGGLRVSTGRPLMFILFLMTLCHALLIETIISDQDFKFAYHFQTLGKIFEIGVIQGS